MKIKQHVIIIEERRAYKREKGLYGETKTENGVTKIFINQAQSSQERINTFFHEIAHAFHHMYGYNGPSDEEERVARLIGNIVEPVFRKYKRGKTSEYKPTGKHH